MRSLSVEVFGGPLSVKAGGKRRVSIVLIISSTLASRDCAIAGQLAAMSQRVAVNKMTPVCEHAPRENAHSRFFIFSRFDWKSKCFHDAQSV
jgi:hypothetical protein